jgi:hypothetical protein
MIKQAVLIYMEYGEMGKKSVLVYWRVLSRNSSGTITEFWQILFRVFFAVGHIEIIYGKWIYLIDFFFLAARKW